MQPVAPDDPRLPSRPLWGMAILLLPVIAVVLTFLAYAGTLGFGVRGRAPSGERARLAFTGCPEAADVVAARLGDMGLTAEPIAVPGGFGFDLVLPGEPDVAARIPSTLSATGQLEIRGEGTTLATSADVTGASVRMDLMMIPSVLVTLRPDAARRIADHVRAHPRGRLEFFADGGPIGTQSNQNPVAVGEVEISPDGVDDRGRWLTVAEGSVTLDHPLPCAITPAAAPPPDR